MPALHCGNPDWPNLAGQQEAYFIKQMQVYRDGNRQDPLMSPMAEQLNDTDIANLTAYYHDLKNCP